MYMIIHKNVKEDTKDIQWLFMRTFKMLHIFKYTLSACTTSIVARLTIL